jgi:beta-N-acetylhexosaminidase
MRRLTVTAFLFLLLSAPRAVWALPALSDAELAGQTMIVFFRGAELDEATWDRLDRIRPGGVILYSSAGNVEKASQVARLVDDLQRRAVFWPLPPFVAIDQEGGRVNRLTEGIVAFPGAMALGATGDEALSAAVAGATAEQLRELGVTVDFAPVADVNVNAANPVIGVRSFGSDAEAVARLASAWIRPFAEAGVLCSAKHFPGHGDTDVDSHLGLPRITQGRNRLEAVELLPFRRMIDGGVPAVMTAHVVVPALEGQEIPATFSRTVLHDLLREEMGFSGLLISDSLGMGALDRRWGVVASALRSLEAGVDLLIFGADRGHEPEEQTEAHEAIVSALRSGRLDRQALETSLARIVAAKRSLGLLDDARPRHFGSTVTDERTALARQVAERALTLLRSDGSLPLTGTVPLLCPEGRRERLAPLLKSSPFLTPLTFSERPSPEERRRIVEVLAGEPLVAVAAYDLTRKPETARFLASLGETRLLLLSLGTPYDIALLPRAATAVAAYGDDGFTLEALARLLGGEISPQGRLPVDIPGHLPRRWGLLRFP